MQPRRFARFARIAAVAGTALAVGALAPGAGAAPIGQTANSSVGESAYSAQVAQATRQWAHRSPGKPTRINVTVAWKRTYMGGWAKFAEEHGIPIAKGNGSKPTVSDSSAARPPMFDESWRAYRSGERG